MLAVFYSAALCVINFDWFCRFFKQPLKFFDETLQLCIFSVHIAIKLRNIVLLSINMTKLCDFKRDNSTVLTWIKYLLIGGRNTALKVAVWAHYIEYIYVRLSETRVALCKFSCGLRLRRLATAVTRRRQVPAMPTARGDDTWPMGRVARYPPVWRHARPYLGLTDSRTTRGTADDLYKYFMSGPPTWRRGLTRPGSGHNTDQWSVWSVWTPAVRQVAITVTW